MFPIPVALIVFNRPDVTRRTFESVRTARPERLFVIGDGPRVDRPQDAERCAAVRSAVEAVDWPCEVRTRFSADNLGCEGNVETGLDWVFSQVDRAIVLEDDCLPDPTFFRFASELLDRYAEDPRVWHIAGNSHGVPTRFYGDASYAFSTWASVWGWATWADRWQAHRSTFHRDHVRRSPDDRGDAPVRSRPAVPASGALVTRAGRRHFADAATSQDVITHGWDKHWWLTIMTEGGLSVSPSVNLVENVGFGADATHTGAPGRRDAAATAITFPLRHPAQVVLNEDVERELELELARIGGRAAQLARRVVRSPILRKAVRRVIHSAPARGATRQASRMMQRRGRVGAGR